MEQDPVSAAAKKAQLKRYGIFIFWACYLVVLFFRNFPSTGPLASFHQVTNPFTYGIGINHFGWNMFAGGKGVSHNQLSRVRFTTLTGQTYYETLIKDKIGYKRTAWHEFSYKLLQGDARIRDGFLTWYCRNGYGGLPLSSVVIEQAWVPLDEWTRANHTYLTPPSYFEAARVTCSSQS